MLTKRSISTTNFLICTILVSVLICLFGFLLIRQEYIHFRAEARDVEENYLEFRKTLIKNEVDEVFDFIQYKQQQLEDRVNKDLKARVCEAHAIAGHLYEQYRNTRTQDEIEAMVREAIRPIRFGFGGGYYFATSLDGVDQLFADRPEYEGRNILRMQDTEGKSVIMDMIRIARSQGEGFYSYTWTKPGAKGRNHRKLAFVKYFQPFHWAISAGEYLDDMEREIQREVLERIRKIRFGEDGYIFVFRSDGTYLNHTHEKYGGRDMMWVTDPNGLKIHERFLEVSKNPGGGFLRYVWNKPSIGRDAPKLGFARVHDKWKWVVGTGVYIDDLEREIAQRRKEAKDHVQHHVILIIVISCSAFVASLLAARLLASRLQKGVDAFVTFFGKAAASNEKMEESSLAFSEFRILAQYANKMVDGRASLEEARRDSEDQFRRIFEGAEDGILAVHPDVRDVVLASPGMCKLTGYSQQELLDLKVDDIHLTEELPHVLDKFYGLLEGRISIAKDVPVLRKDGKIVYCDVSCGSSRQGDRDFMYGFFRDVSERRTAEQRFRLAAQLASDLIYEWHVQDDTLSWFGGIEEALGYEPGEIPPTLQGWLNLVHPDDATRLARVVEQQREAIESVAYEYRVRRKDGT